MAVVKIVYTLLIIGVVGFLFLGQRPEIKDGRLLRSIRRSGPRIKLHKATAEVNPKLDHIAFDPRIAEFEQKFDDRAWEQEYFRHHMEETEKLRHPQAGDHLDESLMADGEASAKRAEHHPVRDPQAEDFDDYHIPDDLDFEEQDYFSPDHFNITERLATLFPSIDVNPYDGYISLEELSRWHVEQAKKTSYHRTDREMEVTDRDGDGKVTLKEYLHDESPGDEIQMELPDDSETNWINTAKHQFPLADADGDGKLNRDEFNDFLHPEDSHNPKLKAYQRKEELRHRDTDHDGKISYTEFYDNLFNELRDFGEEDPVDLAVRLHTGKDPQETQNHVNDAMETKKQKARNKFAELDRNQDGFLTEEEMEPLMEKLQPGEAFYARQQAEHMVEQADGNKDGRLTLEEMVQHPYVFYNVAYDEENEMHDEFR